MRRFERIYDVVEPVEEYRQGGYHPVHLYDVFHQRFEVIGKLAYGQYSTVWLARDQLKNSQQVVLKILKAEASQDNNRELSILLTLSDSNTDHPGKKRIVELLDHFYTKGPNGTHLCLVFPTMISDGAALTVSGSPREVSYIRAISRQLLLGLDFLHQSGIVHCGVTVDDSAPEYLVPSQRRRGQLSDAQFSTLEVRIGDFGGGKIRISKYVQHCDEKPVTPLGLRAPELFRKTRDTSIDTTLDIWALGCLIFELATNEPLLPLDTFGVTREEIDSDHGILIKKRLGSNNLDGDFAEYLRERLPENFGAKNAESLASFLLLMLQIDPCERLPADELLQTSFMMDGY
ncbi:hypothetical protein ASPFODRAFT_59710 [Aspergillus luchuensis CBS 106.47]|uniref:non-specific serine/threonine protein kinase n=1 Tax=Aspergillus luchuensis (strain CBS 106.47) TaxID=1137211 RepID=A0A1M3TKQ7_ASPLC|nr:hypothetical protein ASPFODRAFT_59710 [Aspergillus luchuensis CBS 106.47]